MDAALHQAATAGAHILKPDQETLYGSYAGYFQDLDGHRGSGHRLGWRSDGSRALYARSYVDESQ
ncbi:hypothetical protein [Xylophilus sp.]|uniref:hypothetical protein n=1 Tax=Xylophilus sp. TaxID=2653893 RepID=UPI0013B6264D|nr:MAG: hypothetical protein GAK38_04464 [Xylophilus sp.]